MFFTWKKIYYLYISKRRILNVCIHDLRERGLHVHVLMCRYAAVNPQLFPMVCGLVRART